MYSWYLKKIGEKPVQTKAVTAACIQGCSDLVAQKMLAPSGRLNLQRTGLMALFGLAWAGPGLHYWQQALERAFKGKPQTLGLVLKKSALDQSCYGPVANLAIMAFITLM